MQILDISQRRLFEQAGEGRVGGVSLLFLEEMIPKLAGLSALSQWAEFQEYSLGDPMST